MTEKVTPTGKRSGKGETRHAGRVAIKKGKDGVREEARQIEAMKREMDCVPLRTRYVTDAYRDGWERVFGKKVNGVEDIMERLDAREEEP